jgi:hypothetical protein
VVPDAFDEGKNRSSARSWWTWATTTMPSTLIAPANSSAGGPAFHRGTLPRIVEALKVDPVGWYRANKIEHRRGSMPPSAPVSTRTG